MKLTYTTIKEQYLRSIGKAGSTDANILADFQLNLGQRYQLALAKMRDYLTQVPKTASTVASQQYYHYPAGVVMIDACSILIGSVRYPLTTLYSQHTWDTLNAIQIQPSAIPQFIYPRRDDFGIWPIPQGVYTIEFKYFQRDRNLLVEDYTTGTIALTNASTTVTGTGTTFTSAMAGRWLTVTDTTKPGQGYWYRITTYNNATSLTLENGWEGTTNSGMSYKIGECPEIPDEGHILLVDGPIADYYAGLQSAPEKATWFNNRFWTGDGNNNSRDEDDEYIAGGLIGLINRYKSRDDRHLIRGQPRISPAQYKVFATSLSSS
jgi:hypothetical protein